MHSVTVLIRDLQAAEGLTSFGDAATTLSSALVSRERVLIRYVKLSTAYSRVPFTLIRGAFGWRLGHDHCLLRDQAEVHADGGEEVPVPLRVPFQGGVKGAVVREEKFMDGGCGYKLPEVHPPMVEELAAVR
ncbi:hypothetical protein SprV_0702336500 [Sparganum proliferum]